MKKRLLFFCPRLDSGGAEMHLARLIASLPSDDFEKRLATTRGGGRFEKLLGSEVETRALIKKPGRSATLSLIRSIQPLAREIKAYQPDLIFSVMDHANLAAYVAWRWAGRQGKIVASVQTSIYQAINFHPNDRVLKKTASLTQRVYPKCDKVICLSNGVEKELKEKIGHEGLDTVVINNYGLSEVSSQMRDQGQSGSDFRIVVCGRLIPLKGFDTVVRALARLRKTCPEAKLIVLGEGPELENLQRLARELSVDEHVEFPGFVDRPDQFFQEAQVFCLSSHYEGFGNVIVEAMATGCPVVATDCPFGPAEIISDGETGLLIPIGDDEKMADCFLKIRQDRELSRRLSVGGIERAKDFLPDSITSQHVSLFSELLR